nr:MAG TPA: hypothetical protein [Caudoviricetes sp.]
MIWLIKILLVFAIMFFALIVMASLLELGVSHSRNGVAIKATEVVGPFLAAVLSSAWIVFIIYVLERLQ